MKYRICACLVLGIALEQGVAIADDESVLTEVLVTAQKREQPAQDVGVTMNILDADSLAGEGVVVATDIAKFVPGVSFAGSFAGENLSFSIRGVTQQDFFVHAESPIAVYLDDGYFANNDAASLALFDIDHIEILKGPQGTLFGRNATGGLVSIETTKPSDQFQGYVDLSGGSYDTHRVEIAVGGPINSAWEYRVAGLYDDNGAWVRNTSPTGGDLGGQTTRAIRAHLRFHPDENLDVLATAYGSWQDESWGPYLVFATRPVLDANGNVINTVLSNGLTGIGTESSDAKNLTVDANSAQSSGNFNNVVGGTINATWTFGPTLASITDWKNTAYRLQLDDDAGPTSFFNTDTHAAESNYSEELRLFDASGHTRWTTGLYYLHVRAALDPDIESLPAFGVTYVSPSTLTTNSYSAFAQVEQDLVDHLTLVGGVRVTSEKKEFDYSSTLYTSSNASLGPARSPYSGSSNDTLVPAKLQLEYRPWHDLLLYGGYNRGAKAGNFNAPFAGSTAFPDSGIPYKPETLNDYEIGFKSTVFEHTTQIDGAVFYYDYHNYQSFEFIGLSSEITNNPAKAHGGEISVISAPLRFLKLWGGAAYTENQVDDVSLNPNLPPLERVAAFTPKWTANAGVRLEAGGFGGTFAAQSDISYDGEHYFSITNYSSTRVAGYAVTNARVSWESGHKQWEVAAFVNNLTDKRYETVGFDLTEFAGSNFAQIAFGKPRWFGGSVRYRF